MGIYVDLEEMYRENGLMDIHGRIQPIDRYNFDNVDDKRASRTQPRFTVDNGQTVYVHLFENVINYENYPPLQMMFALKEFNAGKLDTHLWFFEGFAHHIYRVMNERAPAGVNEELYCVCLDAGTRPEETAIVKLINAMDKDRNVAGCCGEITVDKALAPKNVFYNWYVASQDFKYKVGNCLDKAFESVCGYISVLPGAFSAYRWSALSPPELGPTSDKRPIVPYFKSVTHGGVINPFYGNMYLAEDRILALELVCSRTAANTLKYVKNSVAVTDVPDSCAALIKQRRRWMNGSFFAQIFALWQGLLLFRIFTTRHSWFRKLILMNELLFSALNTILTWFLVGIFYLTFIILWNSFLIDGGDLRFPGADAVYIVIQFIYLILMFTTFLLAMGTQPDSPRRSLRALYKLISLIFGVYMVATFAVAVYNVVTSTQIVLMAIGLAAVLRASHPFASLATTASTIEATPMISLRTERTELETPRTSTDDDDVGAGPSFVDGATEADACEGSNAEDDKNSWTTVMLKNIPNKYDDAMLADEIWRRGLGHAYSYIYAVPDPRTGLNRGYAFIDLKSHELACEFMDRFEGVQLPSRKSSKVCACMWANKQGARTPADVGASVGGGITASGQAWLPPSDALHNKHNAFAVPVYFLARPQGSQILQVARQR
ncbi:Chitin synthase, class 2 [Perkinsus olseni]|uniref:chitin synthase n=1 Tax=Perkinsus olseni TaxID=32597 RepID=A0A7J6NBE2_PEROL|nr:Chitin synthase, class 2 [Perkinsus olseni]